MSNQTVEVTAGNFKSEVLESDIPVVLDFWAPWCGPCRMIGPILTELAGRYAGRVKVGKLNVDEEQSLASMFRIQGIPTLIVFADGKPAKTIVGFHGRAALETLFHELGAPRVVRGAA